MFFVHWVPEVIVARDVECIFYWRREIMDRHLAIQPSEAGLEKSSDAQSKHNNNNSNIKNMKQLKTKNFARVTFFF